jgi:hypothetical protein
VDIQSTDGEIRIMTQQVKLPDGSTANFPDDMAPDQISSVLKGHLSQKQNPAPQAPMEPSNLDKAVEAVAPINAFGSGLRAGATDFAGEVGGLITEMLGKVSPGLANRLQGVGRSVKSSLDKADQDMFSKEQADNPIATAIGKGTGYTAGAYLAGRGVSAGASALPISSAGRTAADLAGQGAIGSAMAGEGNRTAGFVAGSLLPPVAAKVLGGPASYIAANLTQNKQIPQMVGKLNTSPLNPKQTIYDATDEAFAQFKAVPGEVRTIRPQAAIEEFVNKAGTNLTPKQLLSIQELQEGLKNSKNLEDLHQARKSFTKSFDKIFLKGNDAVYGKTREALMATKNTVESNLKMNAEKLGALDEYNLANKLYKQSREADIVNEIFTSSKLPEGGNNWLAFNKKIITLKNDKSRSLSATTKDMLTGIQKTLTEANHLYGVRTKELGIISPVLSVIKAVADNMIGRNIFIRMGTEGGRALAKTFVETIANTIQAKKITGGENEEEIE